MHCPQRSNLLSFNRQSPTSEARDRQLSIYVSYKIKLTQSGRELKLDPYFIQAPLNRVGKQFQRINYIQKLKKNRAGKCCQGQIFLQDLVDRLIIMKSTDIQVELKNYKIRQGYLLKRSRVLREWRKRWVVLTMNYLFSFESEECEKATQAIDLKEVVSLKSVLKKPEDCEPNCFYIQTKSVDFVFSTKQASEKWSWIVTFERLFDFKQQGASSYNNIDQIRTQGFESQNEFQLMQKSNFKITRKTILPASKKDSPQLSQTDALLKKIIDHQDNLSKREEELLKKQKALQRIRQASSECTDLVEKFKLRVQELESEINQFRATSTANDLKPFELTVERSKSGSVQVVKITQTVSEDNKQRQQKRQKCIEYLLDEFQDDLITSELTQIVRFMVKISAMKDNNFYRSIQNQIKKHQKIQNFTCMLLETVQNIEITNNNIKRAINMLKMVFYDQDRLSEEYYQKSQKIVLALSSKYCHETPIQLLNETISLLLILLQKTKGTQSEQATKIITHISEISDDSQYRKKCSLALSFIKKAKPPNESS